MPPGEQPCTNRSRPLRRPGTVTTVALSVLAVSVAACGGSTATLPTSTVAPSTTTKTGTSVPNGHQTTTTKASVPATTTAASGGCSLSVIEAITGESTSQDEAKTASWVIESQSNWTVFVPDNSWVLSASTAGGADVQSTDGSDASLSVDEALTPLSYQGLTEQLLSPVSNIHEICQSPNEVDANGETQATEITGVFKGEPIHMVYALTISAVAAGSEFHGGDTRLIYAPTSQWSTSTEQTLWLIVKRAIFSPSAP
ncbi:MAG: hypothetical protein ABSE47_09675 [Acidimicrobiales bacterium]